MAPDFERLARMPWPIASLASSGIRVFNSALDRSCSTKATGSSGIRGEFGPGIGRAHIDDPYRLDSWPRRLDSEQARGLAILDAAPELLLRGQQQVLISGSAGIVILTHLPPPVMIESTDNLVLVTHIQCCTWGMYFSAAPSSENDHGSMNFASNTAPVSSTIPSSVAPI